MLEGHEAEYLRWFFSAKSFSHRGVHPEAQAVYAAAYAGREALRGVFEHYRAMPMSAHQIESMAQSKGLVQSTLAIAGGGVGDALHRQLQPLSDNLSASYIKDCGHNIPEEQPDARAHVLLDFFTGDRVSNSYA